jgi:hypothetical protein
MACSANTESKRFRPADTDEQGGLVWMPATQHAICRFRARFPSFKDCSRTSRRARLILNVRAGATGLFVRAVRRPTSPIDSPIARLFFGVGTVKSIAISPPAPSWSVHTRLSRYGSGRPIWSPARRRVSRPFSFNASSGFRATRRPFRFFTNCVSAWCARIRTK